MTRTRPGSTLALQCTGDNSKLVDRLSQWSLALGLLAGGVVWVLFQPTIEGRLSPRQQQRLGSYGRLASLVAAFLIALPFTSPIRDALFVFVFVASQVFSAFVYFRAIHRLRK